MVKVFELRSIVERCNQDMIATDTAILAIGWVIVSNPTSFQRVDGGDVYSQYWVVPDW